MNRETSLNNISRVSSIICHGALESTVNRGLFSTTFRSAEASFIRGDTTNVWVRSNDRSDEIFIPSASKGISPSGMIVAKDTGIEELQLGIKRMDKLTHGIVQITGSLTRQDLKINWELEGI